MLAVDDSIQYVTGNARPRLVGSELFKHVAGRLAALATSCECAVVILAHFAGSRENRKTPVPMPSPTLAYGGAALEHAVSDYLIYHRPYFYDHDDMEQLTVMELSKGRFATKRHVIARSNLATKTYGWWDGLLPEVIPTNGTRELTRDQWLSGVSA